MSVDDRGGYFKQKDMMMAVVQSLESKGLKDEAMIQAQKEAIRAAAEEVMETIAYNIRVMLAHLRRRCDMREEHVMTEMTELFQMMCNPTKKTVSKQATLRQQRLGRKHPFLGV